MLLSSTLCQTFHFACIVLFNACNKPVRLGAIMIPIFTPRHGGPEKSGVLCQVTQVVGDRGKVQSSLTEEPCLSCMALGAVCIHAAGCPQHNQAQPRAQTRWESTQSFPACTARTVPRGAGQGWVSGGRCGTGRDNIRSATRIVQ